jgi:hypothetical protein
MSASLTLCLRQTCRNTTLARRRLPAQFCDVALTGAHSLLELVEDNLKIRLQVVKFERALGADFVLMRFHAIDDAAFAGCQRRGTLFRVGRYYTVP